MTDKHITDQAYDIIDSSLTGPEAFAAGPVFNTPHQLQFKAIKEYEENRYEANKIIPRRIPHTSIHEAHRRRKHTTSRRRTQA